MADVTGRPQGGMKSEEGKAAYWRMQYESAVGALADLIVEHRETIEQIEDLCNKWDKLSKGETATTRQIREAING